MHFGHDFVQGLLQRVDARLREMGETALLRRSGHFELAQLCMDRFKRPAGRTRRAFDAIGLLPKIRHRVFGRADVGAQGLQARGLAIEHLDGLLDQLPQAFRLRLDLCGRRLRCPDPRLELAVGFLDPRDVGIQRAGAFQERRVRRLCFGRAPCERLQSFARIAKPMLCVRQLVVGCALLLIEPRNRLARFALPRVETLALLFGAAPFNLEQLELLLNSLQVVGRALQLHLETDNRLFLAM